MDKQKILDAIELKQENIKQQEGELESLSQLDKRYDQTQNLITYTQGFIDGLRASLLLSGEVNDDEIDDLFS